MSISNEELIMRQSLPLEVKERMSMRRIRDYIHEYDETGVYLAFSGGKDSSVVKHLLQRVCEQLGCDVPTMVYNDTWMELPEVRQFVKDICKDNELVRLKPELSMIEVIEKCGWCFPSKETAGVIAGYLNGAPSAEKKINGFDKEGNPCERREMFIKWKDFADHLPKNLKISNGCCIELKEKPAMKYELETGKHWINALMADEGGQRKTNYMKYGCISLEGRPTCSPIGFWTNQDIYQYILKYNLTIASPYGKIVPINQLEGQTSLACCPSTCKYGTTGESRTGCAFCPVACHLDTEIKGGSVKYNKFERLKKSHLEMYNYCMDKLGLGILLDYVSEWLTKDDTPYKKGKTYLIEKQYSLFD